MYGPKVLGKGAAAGAATLAVTGDSKVVFITAGAMLALGVSTFLIAKVVRVKG